MQTINNSPVPHIKSKITLLLPSYFVKIPTYEAESTESWISHMIVPSYI
jgi:hypothetical protein